MIVGIGVTTVLVYILIVVLYKSGLFGTYLEMSFSNMRFYVWYRFEILSSKSFFTTDSKEEINLLKKEVMQEAIEVLRQHRELKEKLK